MTATEGDSIKTSPNTVYELVKQSGGLGVGGDVTYEEIDANTYEVIPPYPSIQPQGTEIEGEIVAI